MTITTELIRQNAFLAGIAITAGLYFQAYRIFKTQEATNISLVLIVALVYHEVSWLVYGIHISEWPIFALTVATIPAVLMLVIGYTRYGRPTSRKHQDQTPYSNQ